VSSYHRKRTRYFSATDPHQVVHDAQERAQLLADALPSLLASFGQAKTVPKIRFFPGKTGIKVVLEEILREARKSTSEFCSFSSVDDVFGLLGKDFYEFVRRRVERGIRSRVIMLDTPKAWERIRLAQQELREVRLIPKTFAHHGMTFLCGDKIALLSLQNEYLVTIIESRELAQTQRMMFEALWASLPYPPKY
jgi:sugar-specific transcriptional regulator TrmB